MKKRNSFLIIAVVYLIAIPVLLLFVIIHHFLWDVWIDFFKALKYTWIGFRVKFHGGSNQELFDLINKGGKDG